MAGKPNKPASPATETVAASVAAAVDITDVAPEAVEVSMPRNGRSIPVGVPVQFVLDRGHCRGEVRAAVVVKKNTDGSVNLQVFTDGDGNKVGDSLPPVLWVKNAVHDAGGAPGTFRAIA